MKLEEARRLTKYFGAGVSADIWCYHGDGNWSIKIRRDATVDFTDLMSLKKSLFDLLLNDDMELWPESRDAYTVPIKLADKVDRAYLVAEIRKAVAHIQECSKERAWMDIPEDLFERFLGQRVKDAQKGSVC